MLEASSVQGFYKTFPVTVCDQKCEDVVFYSSTKCLYALNDVEI